jgi:hypothetical protein
MARATSTAPRTGARRPARGVVRARPSVAKDWEDLQRTLGMFEQLVEASARERERERESRAAAEMEQLAWQHLRDANPIRVSHAEKILGVSNQTVRSWIQEGVLDDFGGSPQRVGLDSVLRAKLIADELREQGRDRDFMSAVLSRLEALALRDDREFRRSVGQMRRGQRRPRPY